MVKVKTSGYTLLEFCHYVLEVRSAEPVDDYGPQLKVGLRVAEGKNEGSSFFDYPSRAEDGSVKAGTKAWQIFEACLNRRLTPNDELDTDDLLGKRFEARVVIKKGGKGNRTEFDTITPASSV
jgi:hypothetical protein